MSTVEYQRLETDLTNGNHLMDGAQPNSALRKVAKHALCTLGAGVGYIGSGLSYHYSFKYIKPYYGSEDPQLLITFGGLCLNIFGTALWVVTSVAFGAYVKNEIKRCRSLGLNNNHSEDA